MLSLSAIQYFLLVINQPFTFLFVETEKQCRRKFFYFLKKISMSIIVELFKLSESEVYACGAQTMAHSCHFLLSTARFGLDEGTVMTFLKYTLSIFSLTQIPSF